ncbi:MAG: L-seryl-tRNA(Sec) selenium transferase, partial [Helicobacteraceae bacterium]|nr:L-seryl-tRNA(Sec) selenium transferase [Helicobacteraceae bacterium]
KALIDKLKKNQMLRMLRVGKFTIAVLEATLRRYLLERENEIPTLLMLRAAKSKLLERANNLLRLLAPRSLPIEETINFAGGGALPTEGLEGIALVVDTDVETTRARLRKRGVIARVENERLYLEMRTVFDRDLKRLAEAIKACL